MFGLQFIWIKTIQNAIVFAISVAAFSASIEFYNSTASVVLPEAPKAT